MLNLQILLFLIYHFFICILHYSTSQQLKQQIESLNSVHFYVDIYCCYQCIIITTSIITINNNTIINSQRRDSKQKTFMRTRDKPKTAIVERCIFQCQPETQDSQWLTCQIRRILMRNHYKQVTITEKCRKNQQITCTFYKDW